MKSHPLSQTRGNAQARSLVLTRLTQHGAPISQALGSALSLGCDPRKDQVGSQIQGCPRDS